ncbi:AEGP protein, partial [Tricholaema leucomelas]|nr:AEGP protein [Tricholaema leucomelas]
CPASRGVLSPVVSPIAGAALPASPTAINSCSSAAEKLCNFICDCSDCSDENQCGYLRGSAVLGTSFTCDFEEGDCGWKDVSTSTYRWVRDQANLAAWGTGPHSDHSVGTNLGWFMMTVSPPAKTRATAWLRAPVMQEAAATCEIRAWYHLSGSGFNQTKSPVLHLAMAHRDEVVGLWQSPEHGGEGWHQLVAYPGRITKQFQLILSLTQAPMCAAELALDDITFRNCGLQRPGQQECGEEEGRCRQGSCLALHRFCDGTDDCGDGSDEDAEQCKSFTLCSFEQDLCSWAEAGQTAWERNTSLSLGSAYGIPTRDHTSNSRAGFFLRVGSTLGAGSGGIAKLKSQTFQATNSCSLVLYCHLHGSASSSLSISYMTSTTEHVLRERTGDLGSCWVRERVDFNTRESFQVLIEGVAGSGGTVAIDDLILSGGCMSEKGELEGDSPPILLPSQVGTGPCAAGEVACESGGHCIGAELSCDFAETCADGSDEKSCGATTFETGAGGWHDASVGRLRWAVHKATEHIHTTLTGEAPLRVFPCPGAVLALQAAEGQMVAAARALTPLLGPSGPACAMELSYHIRSGPQGFLAINVVDHTTGTTHLAWHTQGHSNTAKGHVSVPLGERSRPFQVELLGLVDLQASESAAIDNVEFVQCISSAAPPGHTELSCNFERGLCGWYQDQTSDFKWVHSTGQGQGSDHTTGSGYLLAADPSAAWTRGQRAQLITYYQEPAAAQHCLSFWYRLAGPQIGTLNLKLQLEGGEETVLWTQQGTQGSVWHQGQATLPTTSRQRYRVRVRCPHPVLPSAAGARSHLTLLSRWQVAFEALRDRFLGDMALDDLALTEGSCRAKPSCSFEVDACGLVPSGQHTWLRQSNSTGSTAGPAADHSTGTATGHYMVVSTGRASLPAGHVVALTSQLYQPSAPTQCLTFWHQLSTDTPGSLGVFMEQSGERRKVMTVGTVKGSTWHRGHITIQPDGDWQVTFEAVGAGGAHGYIALDDLHVVDGPCPMPASCDFEQDMCGWSSPSDPRRHSFAWGWKSGVPLAKYPGPKQDHTLGTKHGHYVHFDTTVLGLGGTAARLESQHLPAAADSCLRFWYHMDIPEHLSCGELRVMLHSTAGQRTVWSVTGHQSQGWQSGVLPVRSPTEFQIVFEMTTQRWPMEGTVALDDIVYSAREGCHSSQDVLAEEKSSGTPVAEVVLSLLLAIIILALVAAGGWYWMKQRGGGNGTQAENSTLQGFDNITFRD